MALSLAAMELLRDKGLTLDEVIEVARANGGDRLTSDEAMERRRAWDRDRQAKKRAAARVSRESTGCPPDKNADSPPDATDAGSQKERTKEKVIYNTPLSQEASPPSMTPQAEPKRTKRKTTLDPQAQPTAADKDFAEKAGMDVATMRVQWPDFRLHHCSRGNRMLDWHLTWCTWVRGWQKGYGQPRAGPAPRRNGHIEAYENHLRQQNHEPDRSTKAEPADVDSPTPRLRFAGEHAGDHGEPPGGEGRRFVLANGGHAERRATGSDALALGDFADSFARRWN